MEEAYVVTLSDNLFEPTLENMFLLYQELNEELREKYHSDMIAVCNDVVPDPRKIAEMIDKLKYEIVVELDEDKLGPPPSKTYILTAMKRKVKILVTKPGIHLCCMYKNVEIDNRVIDFNLETAGSIRKDAVLVDKYKIAHGLKDYEYQADICM